MTMCMSGTTALEHYNSIATYWHGTLQAALGAPEGGHPAAADGLHGCCCVRIDGM
jgi:hypothetical protein